MWSGCVLRGNITSLKDNDAAKRFVEELNQAEDGIEAARKEQVSLEQQRNAARMHLEEIIAQLSFETDLDVAIPGHPLGNPPR